MQTTGLAEALKEQFTQRVKFSHYLVTPPDSEILLNNRSS